MDWQQEGALLVEDGNHGENRPRRDEFSDIGMAFIRAADMANYQVLFESAEKINKIAQRRVRKGIGQGGDILISHKGTIGRVARAPLDCPPFVCSPQTTFWRVIDKEQIDPDFLFSLLRSPKFQSEFAVRAGETDMAGYVSLTSQRALALDLPDIEIQREIGEAIAPIDRKIELNRRMNETLEKMAQALFRDWFIDFGPTSRQMEGATDPTAIMGHAFPHEKADTLATLFPAKLANDGLPEGWKNGRLDDWATSSPKTVKPDEVDPETNYIGLEHMPRRSIALGDWETAEKVTSNKACFTKGQVLFGKLRPYFHKVGIAPVDGICSTDIVVVDGLSKALVPFVATLMSSDEFVAYTNQSSTGTKMPRTSWKLMRDYRIARAPSTTVEAFGDVVQPMHDKITHSLGENRTLAEMRDLLLLKLMSGEIRLSETVDG